MSACRLLAASRESTVPSATSSLADNFFRAKRVPTVAGEILPHCEFVGAVTATLHYGSMEEALRQWRGHHS